MSSPIHPSQFFNVTPTGIVPCEKAEERKSGIAEVAIKAINSEVKVEYVPRILEAFKKRFDGTGFTKKALRFWLILRHFTKYDTVVTQLTQKQHQKVHQATRAPLDVPATPAQASPLTNEHQVREITKSTTGSPPQEEVQAQFQKALPLPIFSPEKQIPISPAPKPTELTPILQQTTLPQAPKTPQEPPTTPKSAPTIQKSPSITSPQTSAEIVHASITQSLQNITSLLRKAPEPSAKALPLSPSDIKQIVLALQDPSKIIQMSPQIAALISKGRFYISKPAFQEILSSVTQHYGVELTDRQIASLLPGKQIVIPISPDFLQAIATLRSHLASYSTVPLLSDTPQEMKTTPSLAASIPTRAPFPIFSPEKQIPKPSINNVPPPRSFRPSTTTLQPQTPTMPQEPSPIQTVLKRSIISPNQTSSDIIRTSITESLQNITSLLRKAPDPSAKAFPLSPSDIKQIVLALQDPSKIIQMSPQIATLISKGRFYISKPDFQEILSSVTQHYEVDVTDRQIASLLPEKQRVIPISPDFLQAIATLRSHLASYSTVPLLSDTPQEMKTTPSIAASIPTRAPFPIFSPEKQIPKPSINNVPPPRSFRPSTTTLQPQTPTMPQEPSPIQTVLKRPTIAPSQMSSDIIQTSITQSLQTLTSLLRKAPEPSAKAFPLSPSDIKQIVLALQDPSKIIQMSPQIATLISKGRFYISKLAFQEILSSVTRHYELEVTDRQIASLLPEKQRVIPISSEFLKEIATLRSHLSSYSTLPLLKDAPQEKVTTPPIPKEPSLLGSKTVTESLLKLTPQKRRSTSPIFTEPTHPLKLSKTEKSAPGPSEISTIEQIENKIGVLTDGNDFEQKMNEIASMLTTLSLHTRAALTKGLCKKCSELQNETNEKKIIDLLTKACQATLTDETLNNTEYLDLLISTLGQYFPSAMAIEDQEAIRKELFGTAAETTPSSSPLPISTDLTEDTPPISSELSILKQEENKISAFTKMQDSLIQYLDHNRASNISAEDEQVIREKLKKAKADIATWTNTKHSLTQYLSPVIQLHENFSSSMTPEDEEAITKKMKEAEEKIDSFTKMQHELVQYLEQLKQALESFFASATQGEPLEKSVTTLQEQPEHQAVFAEPSSSLPPTLTQGESENWLEKWLTDESSIRLTNDSWEETNIDPIPYIPKPMPSIKEERPHIFPEELEKDILAGRAAGGDLSFSITPEEIEKDIQAANELERTQQEGPPLTPMTLPSSIPLDEEDEDLSLPSIPPLPHTPITRPSSETVLSPFSPEELEKDIQAGIEAGGELLDSISPEEMEEDIKAAETLRDARHEEPSGDLEKEIPKEEKT